MNDRSVTEAARAAVDATSAAYTKEPLADVEGHLRSQLTRQGIGEVDPSWLAQMGVKIRDGHADDLGDLGSTTFRE
jgi:hypothetical protein